jgi:hypothetical protein
MVVRQVLGEVDKLLLGALLQDFQGLIANTLQQVLQTSILTCSQWLVQHLLLRTLWLDQVLTPLKEGWDKVGMLSLSIPSPVLLILSRVTWVDMGQDLPLTMPQVQLTKQEEWGFLEPHLLMHRTVLQGSVCQELEALLLLTQVE